MTGVFNPFLGFTRDDFSRALRLLMPPGPAFPGPLSAPLQDAAFDGFAGPLSDLHKQCLTILQIESDPATTMALLPDWNTEYGLPDPCTPLNPTIEQQHIALLGKIASIGGQSDAYLIAVAAAMGFTITITHLASSRAGISHAGDPLNGPNADYTMVITCSEVRVIWSVAGQAVAGDPINFLDNTQLSCRLRAIAPADNYLIFNFAS